MLVRDISKDLLLNHSHSLCFAATARANALSRSDGAMTLKSITKSAIALNCARDPVLSLASGAELQ